MAQQPSNNYKTATYVLVGALIMVIIVAAIIVSSISISNSGNVGVIKTINCAIFADAAATQPITSISWGPLSPDSSANYTFYLKNTGNAPCNWTFTESGWNPTNANTYIYAALDFKGAMNTAPGVVIPVVATDSVLANAPQNTAYSYTTTITASG